MLFNQPAIEMKSSIQASSDPRLEILEQPQSAVRFRYKGEGPSHGGIAGANSTERQKTYPAVQIRNYRGCAKVVAQLVTNSENATLHPHYLVGKHCSNGICTVECRASDLTAHFSSLGIQRVKKKDAASVLEQRLIEQAQHMGQPITGREEKLKQIKARAEDEAKNIDFSSVRLLFIAYACHRNGETVDGRPIATAISDPISDSKSTSAAQLKINKLCPQSGSVMGNVEVCLLCEKIHKDDIEVLFFEETQKGARTWEEKANFYPADVYHQHAICFRTPAYNNLSITASTTVMVQLHRKSDGAVSEPVPFKYEPNRSFQESSFVQRKRKTNADFHDHNEPGGKQAKTVFPAFENCISDSFTFMASLAGNDAPPLSNSQLISVRKPQFQLPPVKKPVQTSPMHQRPTQTGPIDPAMLNSLRKKTVKRDVTASEARSHPNSNTIPFPQGAQSVGANASSTFSAPTWQNFNSMQSFVADSSATLPSVQPLAVDQSQTANPAGLSLPQIPLLMNNVISQCENEVAQLSSTQSAKSSLEKATWTQLNGQKTDADGLSYPEGDRDSQKFLRGRTKIFSEEPVAPPKPDQSVCVMSSLELEQRALLNRLRHQQMCIANDVTLQQSLNRSAAQQNRLISTTDDYAACCSVDPDLFLVKDQQLEQNGQCEIFDFSGDELDLVNLVAPEGDFSLEDLLSEPCSSKEKCTEESTQGDENGRCFYEPSGH